MSNIEVGDYLRISGKIAKVTAVDENYIDVDNEELIGIPKNTLKYIIYKHSKELIDLIEVGDYVNGIYIEGNKGRYLETLEEDYENSSLGHIEYLRIYPNEIKSIVTREMFLNAEYRVETN